MNPVSSAVIDAYYSTILSTGDVDGYCHITCNFAAIDKTGVFYRVLYHSISDPPTVWQFHSDFPWERWFFGVKLKFAALVTGGQAMSPPTRLVDQIRIQTVDINNDANFVEVIINTPTDLRPSTSHDAPHNFSFVTGGDIGDANGSVNLRWQDLTKFVSGGRITLTKYGITSVGQKQTLYDVGFSSMPLTQSPDYSSPNFVQINFPLLPPGIILPDPPVWPNPPPSPDPNAPMWVVEGDLLTLTVTIFNNDPDANASTTIATFNFTYYRTARFYQFVDSATQGQPYRNQLQIIQDPWVPIPIQGTFALEGTTPARAGWTLTPDGQLACNNPTPIGPFELNIGLTSLGNAISVEAIPIIINIVGQPVIQAPPQTAQLTLGNPFPVAYSPYATNHPNHWSYTGTLPHGLVMDSTTGQITGIPDQVETPHNVFFSATNAVGVSASYQVAWSVVFFSPPNITSPPSFTTYLEESQVYQITTDQPAVSYRVPDGLPAGLKLTGSVITGIPTGPSGIYVVGIQAANRWGWSPVFLLQITVAVAPPVIYSALLATTPVDTPFTYRITASHSPTSYSASPLPPGLSVNESTGIISGIPTDPGTAIAIILSATNSGGQSDPQTLLLTIVLPDAPVIDTTVYNGRAITAETGQYLEFTFPASNAPTGWVVAPIPSGMHLDLVSDPQGGLAAKLSGQFTAGGLFGVQFVASNRGGNSLPATFHFLVTISSVQAQNINLLGTIMEIWIDLNSAEVGIGNTSTVENEIPVPPTGQALNVKRGDTINLRVVFHEEGVPVDITLNTLKFGIKATLDDDYIIYTDTFNTAVGAGRFSIYPDFSGTNDDLDAVLVNETTTLSGEIQWEMVNTTTGVVTRRSSKIFDVIVLRDLIHPD